MAYGRPWAGPLTDLLEEAGLLAGPDPCERAAPAHLLGRLATTLGG